jgi:hypothetical protein
VTYVEGAECAGCSLTSRTKQNVDHVKDLVLKNCTSQCEFWRILKDSLITHHMADKFLRHLWSEQEVESHVVTCQGLQEML